MKIGIVDYGRGNLRSVQKAFEHVGADARIVTSAREIDASERLVLPGQGAFKDCMGTLARRGLLGAVRKFLDSGRPYLGLCLGLQILFEWSEEHGGAEGLGYFKGKVPRFSSPLRGPEGERLKVPHMGWNTVRFDPEEPLFAGLDPETHFYFVHSYYVAPTDESLVIGRTTYGIEFVSAVRRGPVMATQFHPEKSQRAGLAVIRNFCGLEIGDS